MGTLFNEWPAAPLLWESLAYAHVAPEGLQVAASRLDRSKLLALPVEKLLEVYRRRKVRLLLKARRDFLASADATRRVAQIFGVDVEVAVRSRLQKNRRAEAIAAARSLKE